MKRVVITGMGGVSPIGTSWDTIKDSLRQGRSGVQRIPEWSEYEGLQTNLAAPCRDFSIPKSYDRKKTRSMGRVALLAARASELALADAGLLGSDEIQDGRMGVSYGSSSGSPDAILPHARLAFEKNVRGITATSFIQMMSHTCAANLALFFGLKGRVIPTCSACTSGSQGIGYAYEAVKFGRQKLMLAGGAEELSVSVAAVFDTMYATSTRNNAPTSTPRPFDVERDGLVIGEGACTLVLEDLDHALSRGANIHAEVVGFGTNSDGAHVTNPLADTMRLAIEGALTDASLSPSSIEYVNAHGTATELGDIAESQATYGVFGEEIPISSLKSYMGHTMGAAGALEAWLTVEMMKDRWFAPTLNLVEQDMRCAPLDYIKHAGRTLDAEYVMSNNFAFGGINTSLIFKRWSS